MEGKKILLKEILQEYGYENYDEDCQKVLFDTQKKIGNYILKSRDNLYPLLMRLKKYIKGCEEIQIKSKDKQNTLTFDFHFIELLEEVLGSYINDLLYGNNKIEYYKILIGKDNINEQDIINWQLDKKNDMDICFGEDDMLYSMDLFFHDLNIFDNTRKFGSGANKEYQLLYDLLMLNDGKSKDEIFYEKTKDEKRQYVRYRLSKYYSDTRTMIFPIVFDKEKQSDIHREGAYYDEIARLENALI